MTKTSVNKRKHARTPNDSDNDQSDDEQMQDLPESIVNDVVQYLLIMDRKKLPIKRADIVKNALKGVNRYFDRIFRAATRRLMDVFGIQVEQVTDKSNVSYILINTLDDTPLRPDRPLENDITNGLLLPVLAVIFMSDNEVKEDVIWNFLTTLGINVDDKNPLPELGATIRELLTSVWVKQLYLQYRKETSNEVTEHFFRWGFRAEKQFSKMLILDFVCRIFGDNMKPKSWKLQYSEAQQQQQENQ